MLWTNEKEPILEFVGKYYFLSNFSKHPLQMITGSRNKFGDDVTLTFSTSEHAYQALKTENEDEFANISLAEDANMAKKLGKRCSLRKDWDKIKDSVMYSVLMHKFSHRNQKLTQRLIDTFPSYLQEGNDWGDKYWGCCYFKPEEKWIGENKLGHLLMIVRFQRMMENIFLNSINE